MRWAINLPIIMMAHTSSRAESSHQDAEFNFTGTDDGEVDDEWAEGGINEHWVNLAAIYSVDNRVTATGSNQSGIFLSPCQHCYMVAIS